MKVIISDCTSYKCIVIATFLKKNYPGIEIITYSDNKLSKKLHTKYSNRHFIINSKCSTNPEGYLQEVMNIVRCEQPDYFLPVNSEEMNLLMYHKDLFGKGLSYWGDYDSFKTLNEKNKLYLLSAKLKIKSPKYYLQLIDTPIPFVVKPVRSSSSKGVRYIFTEEEKQEIIHENISINNFVIQEYVKGAGVGLSVFAVNGEIKISFGHRRIFEYPVSGGSSVYRENFSHPEMQSIAERILEKTRWSGFAMFEFKLTPANEIYLIEVNPRIWGSINQGLQNGANYFHYLLGPPSKKVKLATEIKTYLSPLFYISLAGYLLKGDINKLFFYLKNFSISKPDVSFLDDKKGWISILVKAFTR